MLTPVIVGVYSTYKGLYMTGRQMWTPPSRIVSAGKGATHNEPTGKAIKGNNIL